MFLSLLEMESNYCEYIYLSTLLTVSNFEVCVLYLTISILLYVTFLLHYSSEGKCTFIALHYLINTQ